MCVGLSYKPIIKEERRVPLLHEPMDRQAGGVSTPGQPERRHCPVVAPPHCSQKVAPQK